MLNITDVNADVTLFGERYVFDLIHKLCCGFWLLAKRPDKLNDFIDMLPIDDLIVMFASQGSYHIIANKKFDADDYNIAADIIKSKNYRDLLLTSDKVCVTLENKILTLVFS